MADKWEYTIPCGLVARISGFHPGGPGSIPGKGETFLLFIMTFIKEHLFDWCSHVLYKLQKVLVPQKKFFGVTRMKKVEDGWYPDEFSRTFKSYLVNIRFQRRSATPAYVLRAYGNCAKLQVVEV